MSEQVSESDERPITTEDLIQRLSAQAEALGLPTRLYGGAGAETGEEVRRLKEKAAEAVGQAGCGCGLHIFVAPEDVGDKAAALEGRCNCGLWTLAEAIKAGVPLAWGR